MKLKPVLPSLREKKRYLVYEVISKQKLDFKQVSNAIMDACNSFLGILGTAKAGPMVLQNTWNQDLQRGIIKVNHKQVDQLKAALTYAKVQNQKLTIKSLGVSGIIKKAQTNFMK